MGKTFTIAIPQWQGTAAGTGCYHGSLMMTKTIEPDYTVNVHEHSVTKRREGIWYIEEISRHLSEALEVLKASQAPKVVTLAGDCSSGIASVSYLNGYYNGDLLMLHLGAYANLNTPENSKSGKCDSMPLGILLGEGSESLINLLSSKLKPEQIVFSGLRSLSEKEKQFLVNNKIDTAPHGEATDATLTSIIEKKGYNNVFIHIDLDVINPKDFRAVSSPVEGGIRFIELLETIKMVSEKFNVVGFTVAEYQPIGDDDKEKIKTLLEVIANIMQL
ncbi:MAG: arginase family protein [Sphaerochaetaceae bacterium]